MSVNGAKLCSYFLIRIAPDPVRQEFLNIGVALFDPAGGFADLRLVRDYRRLQCLFPGLDLEADLPQLESALREELRRPDQLLAAAEEKFALALQFTPARSVLTADPALELERLFQQYARPPALAPAAPGAALSPRRQLQIRLKDGLQQAGVLPYLNPEFHAAQLVASADTYRFDYHYRPNGVHKLLHAVSLTADSGAIKELSFTLTDLRARLQARGVGLHLTAVTEAPEEFDSNEGELVKAGADAARRWDMHRAWLEAAEVELIAAPALPQLGARIRADLHLA